MNRQEAIYPVNTHYLGFTLRLLLVLSLIKVPETLHKVYLVKCLLYLYTLLCLQHILKAENDNFSEGIDHCKQHPDLDQLDVRSARQ